MNDQEDQTVQTMMMVQRVPNENSVQQVPGEGADMFYRARAHVRVHYRQYLSWMTAAWAYESKSPNAYAELVADWRRQAMIDRDRALDGAWILSGRWS